jgi:hypothetical protein
MIKFFKVFVGIYKHYHEICHDIEHIKLRMDGELSFCKSIVDMDKRIAVLESELKIELKNMWRAFDRIGGRREDRPVYKDRRKQSL